MKTTKTTWLGGQAFESVQNNAKIQIDGHGGFGPKSLLLTGLAGCSGIDVVEVLEKMRVPFAGLEIEVEADQTTEHPKVFTRIHVRYNLRTEESNYDKVKKAVDLSLDKYCGVSAMLKKVCDITYTITIQPEEV